MCDDCQKVCVRLNDAAGAALLDGELLVVSVLLSLASQFAGTPEGRAVLLDRAKEARDLARATRH